MSLIIPWGGQEYDVDPAELTMAELREIKQRTGLGFLDLLSGLPQLDPDAVNGLFWTVDRRTVPDLKFAGYVGPRAADLLAHYGQITEWSVSLGKLLGITPDETGSPGSPNSTDTPPSNSMD